MEKTFFLVSAPMAHDKKLSLSSRLLDERIVFLGEAVTAEVTNRIVTQLLLLEAEDSEQDIYMYINSPGGSVYDGLGILDTIQHIKPDVHTICVGLAASMGAFLLGAGTKGKRCSLFNSRIMIHQPSGGIKGQATDMRIQANEITYLKHRLNLELSNFTGKTLDQVEADTDRDFFMSAYSAKAYGLIDKVISRRP
uniref:ATP-dependent Clp protease proteolytic subunit n=1 Tax=Paulinella micropora TaxID=1928728 RepID=A0A385HZR3_9EUKA|nr:ATP-dependent Clp protease, proteolytic subunit ClpP [Paulinella micropora]AXY63125.1 ATP-dependent Clp protease, proteolytic subunit ClpP [Paulinella micropora]